MIDAANWLVRGVFGQRQLSLRSLADAFPRARVWWFLASAARDISR